MPNPETPQADAADVAFNAKDVLGRPTAPNAWFDAAREETRHWLIPGLGEADDPHCGYPLIDALSNPGKNATVKEGIERAAELADDVVLAVWKAAEPEIERLKAELQAAKEALRVNSIEIYEIAQRLLMTNKIRADQLSLIASRMQFAARSASSATIPARAAVPEGWKLVPLEPTDRMKARGASCWDARPENESMSEAGEIYRAMLSASPLPDTENGK